MNTPQSGNKIELISFPPRELEQESPTTTPQSTPLHDKNSRKIANFVKIESIDVLNLNLTPSAYKVIMYLTKLTTGEEKEAFIEENKPKPLLKLCNFLCLKVTIFMDEAHKVDKILISHYNVNFRQDNVTGKRIRNLEKSIEEPPETSTAIATLYKPIKSPNRANTK